MHRTIAIVEDEPALRDNYTALFERQGYRVRGFSDRQQALDSLTLQLPDLVILDIGLGDEIDGGLELCRELRALSPALAIIFLTARGSDLDSVVGLRLGADDYLGKDISLAHLTARVAALMRRLDVAQKNQPAQQLTHGDLVIDIDRLSVLWKQKPIAFTVTEFWMIHALAKYPGHVRSRDQLMETASILVDGATINSHIKRIRQKFLQTDPEFDAIEAVYGVGYRWLEQ